MNNMRNNSSGRRSRGRNNNNNGNNRRHTNNRSQVFDSNGPEVRIRGTAYQVNEKYLALAKDAASSGDHVLAESYLQHAEHYQRIINSWAREDEMNRVQNPEHYNAQETNSGETVAQEDDLSLPVTLLRTVTIDEVALQEA
jgi:hypothetical protein